MLTEQQVIERLRAAINAAGGQRQFARAHGFTPAYVHDVLHGKRNLASRILAAIGVERVVVYRERPAGGDDGTQKHALVHRETGNEGQAETEEEGEVARTARPALDDRAAAIDRKPIKKGL